MAAKGGYLGGSTIIKVHQKRSKQSKARQQRTQEDKARFQAEFVAFLARSSDPVQTASASTTQPSKAGSIRAKKRNADLAPIMESFRALAIEYTKLTSEPSAIAQDLAIHAVQSLPNIVGVSRELAGFDGWRGKKRVRVCGIATLPKSRNAHDLVIPVDGLDKDWDELYWVLLDENYAMSSMHRMAKDKLCEVLEKRGRRGQMPSFSIPVAALMTISSPISAAEESPAGNASGNRRERYFRKP